MIEEKKIYISEELYYKYIKRFAHYHDPIELSPRNTKNIKYMNTLGKEGKEVAKLAQKCMLKIYPSKFLDIVCDLHL